MKRLNDRISRTARRWSNRELAGIAHLFDGDVVNVSGWRDEDKEGRHYRDYFSAARSYTITNYRAEARGFQGAPGEIFLDLEAPLPAELERRFDVVFNHTVLEHVFDCRAAFANLCAMSRDVVIVVVPFLQPYHSDYGDYWRFTPLALKRMYEASGLTMTSATFNSHVLSSVYVFAVGVRDPARWRGRLPEHFAVTDAAGQPAGGATIPMIDLRGAARRLIARVRPR